MADAKRYPPNTGHLRTVMFRYHDGRTEHFDSDEAPDMPPGVIVSSCSINRPVCVEDFLAAMEKANG
jgi:hypothetical protein